jgi:hypothetical protein
MSKSIVPNWQRGGEEKLRFMKGRERMLNILINKEGE